MDSSDNIDKETLPTEINNSSNESADNLNNSAEMKNNAKRANPDGEVEENTSNGNTVEEEQAPKRIKLDNEAEDSSKGSANNPEMMDTTPSFQTEKDVGITEYISTQPGFKGIFKKRFSDFIVNEISLDGQEVHLTHFDIPVEEKVQSKIAKLFGDEKEAAIKALADKIETEPVSLDVTTLDKFDRREVHETIRQYYPSLRSTTKDNADKKLIVVMKPIHNKEKRNNWPPRRGNYLHCVLYKENKDTMEAIAKLAGVLRMNPSSFHYAGTKDRRGKTAQKICAYQVKAETMAKLNPRFKNQMSFGNFEYSNNELKIGDLMGNRFTITLREVEGDQSQFEEAFESLKTKGFINYFGMQRFGTTSVPTYKIGRALILGEFEEAVNLILAPRDTPDALNEARTLWAETKDAQKAWQALRYKSCIEGHLLKGLATHNTNDYASGLNSIARNTRQMYLHSYQSYIWNRVVSMRIAKYGLTPIVGDLWIKENTCWTLEDQEPTGRSKKYVPEVVTEEDIASDRVNIYQIVLPLPGYDIIYPHKEILEWYKNILEQDGLTIDSFDSKHKNYSLSGAYRNILALPKDLEWSQISYSNPEDDLVLSDYQILNKEALTFSEGSKIALKLQLSLPSSCYATMALREALKCDTATGSLKIPKPANKVSDDS